MILADFKGRHSGEPVAILANGSSILNHDLSKVTCKTIGTNRAWQLLWPTYHVVVDGRHEMNHPDIYRRLASEGRLFISGDFKWGIKIPMGNVSFSPDMEREGVVISIEGHGGSVAYVALQLASYMGFNPIYFLGLDLGGDHFHKEWATSPTIEQQDYLFARTPSGLQVVNVGSPDTRCTAFPKRAFHEIWA